MRFDVLQSISLAGTSATPNDDRLGAGDGVAWVIDGATDLGEPGLVGTRGGAAWIAQEANSAFTAAGDASVDAICKGASARIHRRFEAVRTRAPLGAWELPSASFLLVRAMVAGVECGWLGDCAALLKRGDTVERIGPLASKQAETDHAASLADHDLGQKIRSGPVRDSLRMARASDDRRVLGVDPAMVDHVGRAVLPAAPGDELLLMTDGFAALVDVYGVFDDAGLMAAVSTNGLADVALQLRQIEEDDAGCSRFARFKRSDDATALWLRLAA